MGIALGFVFYVAFLEEEKKKSKKPQKTRKNTEKIASKK